MEGNGVKIKDLIKNYSGHPVLDRVSFSIRDGGIYALMGPSGCGKTTLLHILMGITKADGGVIEGLENRKCSAVFQENRLCEFLTAAENVSAVQKNPMPVPEINRILSEILPVYALEQRVSEYSGGMKRRVAIARAMLTESDILIMDEPLTGLDEGTKEQVIVFILKYRRNRTLLFSTHQEQEAVQFGAEKMILPI